MGDLSKSKHIKRDAFLTAYAEVGTVTHAAELAGVSRNAHYMWMQDDPEYPEKFREAEKQACEVLEKEIRRRAVEGVDEPVFHKGEQCGTVRKYSDTLLIFAAKGAMPEKYRENAKLEIDLKANITGQVDLARLSAEELAALETMLAKATDTTPE